MILSHIVDPLTDSVGRLKKYADSLGVDSKSWIFLTGNKDSLYQAARQSYLLDDPYIMFLNDYLGYKCIGRKNPNYCLDE